MENCYHSVAIESLLDVGIGGAEPRNIFVKMSEQYTGIDLQCRFVRIVGTPCPQALYFPKSGTNKLPAAFGTDKLPRTACKANG